MTADLQNADPVVIRQKDVAGADDHRFSRFELISWWDQSRLSGARVVVIGAGALGNEILKNLALLGIGSVLVADMDRIENSNLSRSCLYRSSDNGRFKAEVACQRARDIYPDMRTHPFIGNIVYDLGRGVYQWADIVLAGMDNREARVSINHHALLLGTTWIDGAIEVLDGVARVFSPGDGPCYECTMTDTDWKMLEARRSCALLTRDEMLQGRTPTTPTTGSIIAGFEVQEAIKFLHDMPVLGGKGFMFNGLTGDAYTVTYPRKPDCYAHDVMPDIVRLGCGVEDMTVGQLLDRARSDLGHDAVVELSRDIITSLLCPGCGDNEPVFCSLGKVSEGQGRCPRCSELRTPETLATLGYDETLNTMRLAEIGVPAFDILIARSGSDRRAYCFDGDAGIVLGPLLSDDRPGDQT